MQAVTIVIEQRNQLGLIVRGVDAVDDGFNFGGFFNDNGCRFIDHLDIAGDLGVLVVILGRFGRDFRRQRFDILILFNYFN